MNSQSTRPRFALFDELDKGFNHLMNEVLKPESGAEIPTTVMEADNHYLVVCDLPGLAEDQIDVSLDKGVLKITAQRAQPEDQSLTVVANERRFGELRRQVKLGGEVDMESVDAELSNGVLTIKVGKPSSVLPRKIQIRGRANQSDSES